MRQSSLLKLDHFFAEASGKIIKNPQVDVLRRASLKSGETSLARHNQLVSVTPEGERGRSPADTYFVDRPDDPNRDEVNWGPPNFQTLSLDIFEDLLATALKTLKESPSIYHAEKTVNADRRFTHWISLLTDRPLTALFARNMFRKPTGDSGSVFKNGKPHTLIVLPKAKFDRRDVGLPAIEGKDPAQSFIIATDMPRKVTLVLGFGYLGPVKKAVFTQMSYELPPHGVLPMHCSANVGKGGDVALFFGLSGTGKTTLSNDPERFMIGDDEHGWSDSGVFNIEGGQYPKIVGLDPDREPMLYRALFDIRSPHTSPVILENVSMDEEGDVDVHNTELTENSRGSFPLTPEFVPNLIASGNGGHPKHIFFITTDLAGVLPPLAKLTTDQALLWFLLGPTSRVAGTEKGTKEPKPVFSRFFGDPFMPLLPETYLGLFEQKLTTHKPTVWLINTGWINGPYGQGKRIPLAYTRALITEAISGALEDGSWRTEPYMGITVLTSASGVPDEILDPKAGWKDNNAYDTQARTFVGQFIEAFYRAQPGRFQKKLEQVLPKRP